MARTFNRAPIQVNTPSANNVKNYFFNHYNWKGLTDNKNVLGVDQETFSDCKNVYIDSEGLLRSRPSLKVKVIKYSNSGEEYILSDVVDVWTFDDVTLYQSVANGKYYLTFINKNVDNQIQVELKYIDKEGLEKSYKDICPVLADAKIFIFAEHDFNYYDIKENVYNNAEDFIYVPVTTTVHGDVAKSFESPNILTKSYITKYMYDKTAEINFNNLVGKDVSVDVDGNSYSINFVYNNEIVFVGRYTGLSKYNFADDYILGKQGEGIPLIQVSERESMLVCSYNYVVDEATKRPDIEWTIYHTIDGIAFNRVPTKENIIGIPKISRDGFYAFVFCKDGPYVYSLFDTTGESLIGTKKYNDWTNLLEHIDETTYNSWVNAGFDLNVTNEQGDVFNQTTQVNGYFMDDTAFAFTYADNLSNKYGDPNYRNFYCVYVNGSNDEKKICREQIFFTTSGTPYSYIPTERAVERRLSFVNNTVGVSSMVITNTCDLGTISFKYNRDDSSGITALATLSDFKIVQGSVLTSIGNPQIIGWKDMVISGNLKIVDSVGNIMEEKAINIVSPNYNPRPVHNGQPSYNSFTYKDDYFTYRVGSVNTNDGTSYYQNLIIYVNDISGSSTNGGVRLPTGDNDYHFANTDNYMPNLYVNVSQEKQQLSVAIDFMVKLRDFPSEASYYRAIYHIEDTPSGSVSEILSWDTYEATDVRTPIRDTCIVHDRKYVFARLVKNLEEQCIYVTNIKLAENSNSSSDADIVSNKIFSENYVSSSDFREQRLILSDPQGYLITNKYLFDYVDYTSSSAEYTPINLLFNCVPVGHFYYGNTFDCIYLATKNALYVSNTNQVIEVTEKTVAETNFILPAVNALLENYYFGKENELYISKFVLDENGKFKWYFPEISKQKFDNDITNLHPISNNEMAVFFENEVWYSVFDADVVINGISGAYRYYKSKLQVGCKNGSDVLTTFDGKYTIFTGNRGLVAMSYQDFVASTEQSLTYLSDVIYDVFAKYISEPTSSNKIKLFKFGYWILIYKSDCKHGFIFDVRNNSWWPVEGIKNTVKFFTFDNSVKLLSSGKTYDLNKSDINYFDYDGKERKNIDWFVKSQKLYLGAVNNYKHVSNVTFVSVHDTDLLEEAKYNSDELSFKLQVNCYRKQVSGNINDVNDFINVNYKVETIRTFVQRLNYSKINEFQYQLSSDEENAIEIPLSLNSITIKYNVGGQVR